MYLIIPKTVLAAHCHFNLLFTWLKSYFHYNTICPLIIIIIKSLSSFIAQTLLGLSK